MQKIMGMKHFILTHLLAISTVAVVAGESRNSDRELIDRVIQWQMANQPNVKHHDLDWTNAVLYKGIAEWAEYTHNESYYRFLIDICEDNAWGFLDRLYHADDLAVAQTYLKLYDRYKAPYMIKNIFARVDSILYNPSVVALHHPDGNTRWSWCDALFMAPPVLIRLSELSGDRKYVDFMHAEFKVTTDSLFNSDYGLFYRDIRYKSRKEENGMPIFWGRGNGWVFGALALIIESLPVDDPELDYYRELYLSMAEAIIKCQDDEGSWHASMLDHNAYPMAENSASSFFVYGLAWGINRGILTGKEYDTALDKGWITLKSYVDAEGKLGSVQPIGASPKLATPDMTEVYGVGAFLMAGSQIMRSTGGVVHYVNSPK